MAVALVETQDEIQLQENNTSVYLIGEFALQVILGVKLRDFVHGITQDLGFQREPVDFNLVFTPGNTIKIYAHWEPDYDERD